MARSDELRVEAERIYLRYARELVEGQGFCPWAAGARSGGRVAIHVVVGADVAPGDALPILAEWSAGDGTDIGLLIFPELSLDRLEFARFTAALREADSARLGRGNTVFALADFHPNVQADTASAERLIPFIRRSPDPTIQCVRHSALDGVRLGDSQGTSFIDSSTLAAGSLADLERSVEPLNRRVARANLRTVEQAGVDRITALMEDILRDRDASYLRLGVPPPPWSPRAERPG